MPNSRQTVDFVIQTAKVTSEFLKLAISEMLNENNASKKQELSYEKIRKQSKLDNIEITENNIADFREVARKYDLQFALKRDKSTEPPTYHIFFTGKDSDTLKRCFSEYAGIKQAQINQPVINTEKILQNARIISSKQEKSVEKNKNLDIGGR